MNNRRYYIDFIKLIFRGRHIALHLFIILTAFMAGFFEAKTILVFNDFLVELGLKDFGILVHGALIYFGFFTLDILFSLIRDILIERGRYKLIFELKNFSSKKMLEGEWEEISTYKKGKTNELLINDLESVANTVWKDFFNFLSTLFSALWLIIALLTISNIVIAATIFVILIPILFMQANFAKKIRLLAKKSREEKMELNDRIYELKDGLFSMRAVNSEGWLLTRTYHQLSKHQQSILRSNKMELTGESISEIAYVISILLIAIVGWFFMKGSLLSIESFVTVFIYAGRVTSTFQDLYYKLISLVKNSLSISHIMEFVKVPVKEEGKQEASSVTSIEIRQLSYKYPTSDHYILRNINFSINKGITSIVGPSGVGKTTLLEILLKLRTPTNGNVFVDGLSLEQISKTSWLDTISFVPQNPYIINDTLLANILFGREANIEDINEILMNVGLLDWVSSLPHGLDSMIGSQYIRPSGGQIKRIAIARALVGNPKFIILDEPTSSIDKTSNEMLANVLKHIAKNTPLLLTSHDYDFVRKISSQIIDLSEQVNNHCYDKKI